MKTRYTSTTQIGSWSKGTTKTKRVWIIILSALKKNFCHAIDPDKKMLIAKKNCPTLASAGPIVKKVTRKYIYVLSYDDGSQKKSVNVTGKTPEEIKKVKYDLAKNLNHMRYHITDKL